MPITHPINRRLRRLSAVSQGSVTYYAIGSHLKKETDDDGLAFPELIEAREAAVVGGPCPRPAG